MKKILFMILAFTCILTGCGFGGKVEPPETSLMTEAAATDSTTEILETVSTEAIQETYPGTVTVDILVEGEPDQLTMDLFDGGMYVIYIPQDTWELKTTIEDGFLRDHWGCIWAPEVWLEIISLGSVSLEEAEEILREQGYSFHVTDEGHYELYASSKVYASLDIYGDGTNAFAMLIEMPVEFGDGFAPRFRAMIESFEIKSLS